VGYLRIVGEIQPLLAQELIEPVAEDEAGGEKGPQYLGLILRQWEINDRALVGGAMNQPVAEFEQAALVAPEVESFLVVQVIE